MIRVVRRRAARALNLQHEPPSGFGEDEDMQAEWVRHTHTAQQPHNYRTQVFGGGTGAGYGDRVERQASGYVGRVSGDENKQENSQK